ncbi:hypothetical protein [Methylobacterium sp. Leaf466]|uniref:hypothetical protein n=1 Tax=Methylobacterium sp. Leaf466 TaxID=1736386 RepID=UPI0006F2BD0E|nr:hypothetical protein [Methylobacterium sp. Leaf466]KQT82409.1 hypothetical protein ASG59_18630 [Methylobacterium sp. Leaf466]
MTRIITTIAATLLLTVSAAAMDAETRRLQNRIDKLEQSVREAKRDAEFQEFVRQSEYDYEVSSARTKAEIERRRPRSITVIDATTGEASFLTIQGY